MQQLSDFKESAQFLFNEIPSPQGITIEYLNDVYGLCREAVICHGGIGDMTDATSTQLELARTRALVAAGELTAKAPCGAVAYVTSALEALIFAIDHAPTPVEVAA